MPKPTNHHDALFRALLDDPRRAAILLREQLPAALAARLTEDPPRLLDGTYIDEHLRDTQSDRLYEVTLTGGKPALLYVLLEHKSAPDPGTPLQLLGYLVRIWTRYAEGRATRLRRLPPILPLVLYHGRQPWSVPTSILDCLDADPDVREWLRDLRYQVRDLGPMPYPERSADPAVRAALGALCAVFVRDLAPADLARILRDLPDGEALERQVLVYIVRHYAITETQFRAALAAAKPAREEALHMTVAQEWIERGIEKGIQQGIQQGIEKGVHQGFAQGQAAAVIGILEARFGVVDQRLRQRLAELDADALRPLIRRAVTVDSVAALFEPPSAPPH
ncbi:Rpn family recombination-promoting nuclease/putative transposase [uncultured Thiocystis sp.]|jgi:predicted transposase YdaD|uniref:Rpn family recombination-promoting nuclease/putative transposase n=1 Tax=uncultured Thiocystis sp. TaxID=1202134 RepID=UPI0025D0D0AA|nr:Rpn family recombination-promoting nuclease/putative transposase [uncultured Thiocystis sp.]